MVTYSGSSNSQAVKEKRKYRANVRNFDIRAIDENGVQDKKLKRQMQQIKREGIKKLFAAVKFSPSRAYFNPRRHKEAARKLHIEMEEKRRAELAARHKVKV